jgi:hypothetical protein
MNTVPSTAARGGARDECGTAFEGDADHVVGDGVAGEGLGLVPFPDAFQDACRDAGGRDAGLV